MLKQVSPASGESQGPKQNIKMCKTLTKGLRIREERSPSPIPEICKALFQAGVVLEEKTKRKSNRPSLSEDKENLFSGQSSKKSLRTNSERRLLGVRNSNVFQFPVPSLESGITVCVEPAEDDDEVFSSSPVTSDLSSLTSGSGRLLLTPSTAHTPINLPSPIGSPNLDKGLCCCTPNRLKLEAEGLDRNNVVLGRGAFGTVVLGRWRGRKVAVKVMEAEVGGTTAKRRKSLESELQARKLDHQNVVKVYAVHAVEQGHAVVIMEYVGSRNLHRLVVERREKRLEKTWLLGAAVEISRALLHCHQRKIIHLDVKPANVFVTSSGVCKLGDFGCSVLQDSNTLSLDHSLVGTPGYQAPEFLRGCEPTLGCDVYSLGILLWQLDSREFPYPGHHPHTVMFRVVAAGARPKLPSSTNGAISLPAFTSLYTHCWAANPESRPTIRSIVERLASLGTRSSLAPPISRLRSMR